MPTRPNNLAEAYQFQSHFAAGIAPTSGNKLGRSSPKLMQATGLDAPLFTPIRRSPLHASSTQFLWKIHSTPVFEVEIACRLGTTIQPETRNRGMCDFVSDYYLATEVVQSRFKNRTAVALPSFVADLIRLRAMIVGDVVTESVLNNTLTTAGFYLNGAEFSRHQAGESAVDPIQALSLFVADIQSRGMMLNSGMIIATGSITKPVESSKLGEFNATLGNDQARLTISE